MSTAATITINKNACLAEDVLKSRGVPVERSKVYRMGLKFLLDKNELMPEYLDAKKSAAEKIEDSENICLD